MKEQVVKVLTNVSILRTIVLATLVTPAQGQSLRHRIGANMPFGFIVAEALHEESWLALPARENSFAQRRRVGEAFRCRLVAGGGLWVRVVREAFGLS